MPRVTLGETERRHAGTANYTVFANGFSCVFGAAWKEAAALTEHRTNAVLIGLDQTERGSASNETCPCWKRFLVHAFTLGGETAGPRRPTHFAAASFAMSCSSAIVHSAITAATSLVVIAILKRTTYCDAGSAVCRRRNCSRIRRLTALRSTAVRAFFLPTMRPSRGRGACVSLPISARR